MHRRILLIRSPILLFALVAATAAPAQAPSITELSPVGVRRGEPTPLAIRGTALGDHPRLIAPFPIEAAPPTEGSESNATTWHLTLTVPPETPLGTYPIRVRTRDGISNPILLDVGQVPQIAEIEPNDAAETAQSVPSPCIVEGRAEGADLDHYRFPGHAGQRIVVDARCARIGSGLDPTLRLLTADGRYVASDDDSIGLATDARLVVELPEDGDYLVELSDSQYRGDNRPSYRLLIGPVPVADEVFPMGGRRGETVGFELRGGTLPGVTIAAATLSEDVPTRIEGVADPSGFEVEVPHPPSVSEVKEVREPAAAEGPPMVVAPPVVINGRLDREGEEDRYVLAVRPSGKYRARVEAAPLASALDGILRVLNADGSEIARGDDSAVELANLGDKDATEINSPDPSVEFDVPEGVTEVTLALRDLSSRGGIGYAYRIHAEAVEPRFEVTLLVPQVSIPRGGSANVPIHVVRRGYDGPVTIEVPELPDGLSSRAGVVPAGETAGVVSLIATPEAEFETRSLRIIGTGEGPAGPIVAEGEAMIAFATVGGFPSHVAVQRGLAAADARPSPIALQTPDEPIELVQGYGASVPVTIARQEGAGTALEIEPLPTSEGLDAPEVTFDEGAADGTIAVIAAPDAPIGPSLIAFTAKGKIAEADRIFDLPAATLDVVPPAALSLAVGEVQVATGASAEVLGTLDRRGPFDAEVVIALADLPEGVTAAPITLAGDVRDFTLTLNASADATAGTAEAHASAAFKLGKTEYPPLMVPLSVAVE